MYKEHIRQFPVLFPGMGSPLEQEIRRVEFDMGRQDRPDRAGAGNE